MSEWTKLSVRGKTEQLDEIAAVMSMLDNGLMIEDYSDVSLDGVSSTDDVAKALSRAMADAACDAHTVLRVIFEGMLPLDFPMYALKNAISACEKDLFHVCMTDATHPDLAHRFCGDGAARGLTLHSELVRAATEQAAVQEADVLRAASAALEGRSLGDAL